MLDGPEPRRAPRPAHPAPRDRLVLGLLTALVILLALPYGARSPGYFREDWISLDHAVTDGFWAAAGPVVSWTRPGAAVVYAVVLGLLAGRPLLARAALVALNAVAVSLLYTAGRRRLDAGRAAAVAAVFAVLPTHASLTHWLSATPVVVALALTLRGIAGVDDLVQGKGHWIRPAAALAAGGLTYESFLPAAGVVTLWLAAGHRRRGLRAVLPVLGAIAAVLAYGFTAGFVVTAKQPVEWIEPARAIGANIGWGLTPAGAWPLVQALILAGTVLSVARLALPAHRSATGVGERLVAAGAALAVFGDWDASAALRWSTGRDDAAARVVYDPGLPVDVDTRRSR